VIDAGMGLMAFIAHESIVGGANLVATTLYETLSYRVRNGFGLGESLHLQLDNTTSENKNLTLIGAVGLLVQRG
jgi:hypothetical protein